MVAAVTLWSLRALGVVAVGFVSGVLSGMFGVGGAVLTTPGIRVLGATAVQAIGSTIPPMLPGAVSGTIRYARKGLVDWRVALVCGGPGALLALAGAATSAVVNAHVLMIVTAALMGWTAWRTARGPETGAGSGAHPPPGPARAGGPGAAAGGGPQAEADDPRPSLLSLVVVGAFAGYLAGLLGIGGGIVMLPAFTTVLRLPIKTAVASSLVAVAIFSVPAMIGQALLGHVDWAYALLLAVGVVPGAQIGSAVTVGASAVHTRVLVAAFLGLLAVVYGVTEAVALFR